MLAMPCCFLVCHVSRGDFYFSPSPLVSWDFINLVPSHTHETSPFPEAVSKKKKQMLVEIPPRSCQLPLCMACCFLLSSQMLRECCLFSSRWFFISPFMRRLVCISWETWEGASGLCVTRALSSHPPRAPRLAPALGVCVAFGHFSALLVLNLLGLVGNRNRI